MAKKDQLKAQLSTGSNALPGGLQALVRGGETSEAKGESVKPVAPKEEKKSVGRPSKNEDVIHTSLVIDRELHKRVKAIGVQQGRDVKDIIREALEEWLVKNA